MQFLSSFLVQVSNDQKLKLCGCVMSEEVPPCSHPPAPWTGSCPRGRQSTAAGLLAPRDQSTRMLLLFCPQGLPPPGGAGAKLKGFLRIYGVSKSQEIPQKPKCCLYLWGPPALPKRQSALCSSMLSSAGISKASPFQGWPWPSSFQWLLCLTGCWLCPCGFQPRVSCP